MLLKHIVLYITLLCTPFLMGQSQPLIEFDPAQRDGTFKVYIPYDCAKDDACFDATNRQEDFALDMPVDCVVGHECFVQNYVDMKAGKQAKDYNCNHLTYDKHKGTDFRLVDFKAMERGYKVLAAAGGMVKGIRDGMADVSIRDSSDQSIDGRECGNGVVIDHGNGYETQYCHLKQGSVAVEQGQSVATGDVLGEIGLSGKTEFPHLHLSIRHQGKAVDPYTGLEMESGCKVITTKKPLWNSSTLERLAYKPTALLNLGLATRIPTLDGVMAGQFNGVDTIDAASELLLFWVYVMGTFKADNITMVFKDSYGSK